MHKQTEMSMVKFLDNLAARWSDEKEHEDFDDYIAAAVQQCSKHDLSLVKLTEKPFALTVKSADGNKTVFTVTSKTVDVKTFNQAKETTMTKTQDLSTMSLAELTEIYNKHADKPIKKFSCSRDAAVAKVQAVLPKKTKAEGTKKLGIGARTVELLKSGKTPADVLAALRAEFGENTSSMPSVYWYSSKIRCGAF